MISAFLLIFAVSIARAEEPVPCRPPEDPDIKALSDPARKLERALRCAAPVSCADGKPFLRAQEAVDADLMAEWLKGQKVDGTIVAVLDTGFDASRTKSGDIRVEQAKALLRGSAEHDEIGHGTAVTSLITGRDGIGVSPNARVRGYRVTNPRQVSQIAAYLQDKALEACREGAEVINISFGAATAFERDKEFLKEIAERGCFVVKGAGNMGYETVLSEEFHDRRDAVIRVHGLDSSGVRPRKFDKGEWGAPGVELTTLAPLGASDTVKCGELVVQRNTGSSGSAPLVSGILAEVLSVLKTAGWYKDLPAPKRVELVTRLLDAAEKKTGVSGFLAVRLADALRAQHEIKDAEAAVKAARLALSTDPACKSAPPQESCPAELRKHALLCQ